jgi:hypothetical protein
MMTKDEAVTPPTVEALTELLGRCRDEFLNAVVLGWDVEAVADLAKEIDATIGADAEYGSVVSQLEEGGA